MYNLVVFFFDFSFPFILHKIHKIQGVLAQFSKIFSYRKHHCESTKYTFFLTLIGNTTPSIQEYIQYDHNKSILVYFAAKIVHTWIDLKKIQYFLFLVSKRKYTKNGNGRRAIFHLKRLPQAWEVPNLYDSILTHC